MIIKTKNSTYQIDANGDHFLVKKIAEVRPNPNSIDIGWIGKFSTMYVEVGYGATFANDKRFDTFGTSIVLEVWNDQPRSL